LLRGGQALARALHLLLMIRAACIAWLVLQTSLAAASDNDDVIVVHLVPHSHIDAGWLVNFDEYQASSVDVILDNVLVQLEQNSTRTFALGEMAFFASWYARQPLGVRARFRKLVASGQVEFVNGGWVQHDEACALYGDMLDQTTRGHQFLLSEFNVRPATTWQLDPFGHSATSSWLLGRDAGFQAFFFARASYRERQARLDTQSLEFMWQGVRDRGAIPASMLYGTGDASGSFYHSFFNFESTDARARNYVVDSPCMAGYNADVWAERVVVAARLQRAHAQSRHVLWMMGDDFTYASASRWYAQMDKLIALARGRGVALKYSSPARYARESGLLNATAAATQQTRTGDMFPLAESAHAVWSGYFSSRPALKRQHRIAAALLRATRQIEMLGRVLGVSQPPQEVGPLPSPRVGGGFTDDLEGAVALVTHHDAVTGTAREAVANDYAQRLALGARRASAGAMRVLARAAGFGDAGATCDCSAGVLSCLNASTCAATSALSAEFSVVLWNALAHNRSIWFDVPVAAPGARVLGPDGSAVPSTVAPLDAATLALPTLYLNRHGLSRDEASAAERALANPARYRLSFLAEQLPAMGFAVFRVVAAVPSPPPPPPLLRAGAIANDAYRLSFDPRTGRVLRLANLVSGIQSALQIAVGSYRPSAGDADSAQRSGAYIFRPAAAAAAGAAAAAAGAQQHVLEEPTSFAVFSNDLVSELVLNFALPAWRGGDGGDGDDNDDNDDNDDEASRVRVALRLRRGAQALEVDYLAGPLRSRGAGEEVFIRYASDLDSGVGFETDANGRHAMARTRHVDEPVASNFFPVTTFIAIQDAARMLAVVTDATQAGASLRPGAVELLVHRRLMLDDGRGMGEPLNETMCGCGDRGAAPGSTGAHGSLGDGGCECVGLVVRGAHRVVLDTPKRARKQRRVEALHLSNPPLAGFFTSEAAKRKDARLVNELPREVDVATLTINYRRCGLLLRLAHLHDDDDDDDNAAVVVDLRGALSRFAGVAVEQTSSTANADGKPVSVVALKPMDVKTLCVRGWTAAALA